MSPSEIYRLANAIEIGQTSSKTPSQTKSDLNSSSGVEFREVLKKQISEDVKLSKHAQNRIHSRTLPWTEDIQKRVSHGMNVADQKGSRETLILADNLALIANVKSRTVVTAMDRDQMKDFVFTNIDSAVLV